MSKLTLYHGSINKFFNPSVYFQNYKRDYGKRFYLTDDINLAREWAVAQPEIECGWVHAYELTIDNLKIIDFEEKDVLNWIAELMKHRYASDSKRCKVLSAKFIQKYGIDTNDYDVIRGWRADASYFYIAKAFVRDEIDVRILPELLHLGGLGIQYCLKIELAFQNLKENYNLLEKVDSSIYNIKYQTRDIKSRNKMKELINSDKNQVEQVFSTLI